MLSQWLPCFGPPARERSCQSGDILHSLFFHLIVPFRTAHSVLTVRGTHSSKAKRLGDPCPLVLLSKAFSFFWIHWVVSTLCFSGFKNLEFEGTNTKILIPTGDLTQS